ncbi:hypothetical protein M9H77_02181 [Catharanthus roseus]|uniref:Uncharacterized protein n=1 Tax=Catharanthus roseus TaxID=4058 RepID=A0ACC0C826_CATRO|nr:hypothetical protein M9H77_02181 [Catharanthus roseus]
MAFLFINTYEKKLHSDQGVNSGYDLVFGSIRGLHLPRGTQMPYSAAVDLVAGLGTSQVVSEHLGTRWHTLLIDGHTGRAPSEIVPEREPIPVIDLSDDESVEGPEMAPVAPRIGIGTSIEEDPSEPTLDSEMTPEPERVAPVATGDMGTFVVDSLPVAASPTPIPPVESVYSFPALTSLLWGGIMELREKISRVDALFYTARQEHRQETARAVMLDAELGQAREAHTA